MQTMQPVQGVGVEGVERIVGALPWSARWAEFAPRTPANCCRTLNQLFREEPAVCDASRLQVASALALKAGGEWPPTQTNWSKCDEVVIPLCLYPEELRGWSNARLSMWWNQTATLDPLAACLRMDVSRWRAEWGEVGGMWGGELRLVRPVWLKCITGVPLLLGERLSLLFTAWRWWLVGGWVGIVFSGERVSEAPFR